MNYKPDYKYIPPIQYNWLTPLYDFLCSITGLGKEFKRQIIKFIKIKGDENIADIGCGTGVFLEEVKQKYPQTRVIGIDPDLKALGIAKTRLARAGLQVELKQGFAENLPLPDNSIDICISSLALHHMPNQIKLKAIQEIYRVLKNGRQVVIADFGKTKGNFWRRLLFFEKLEYLEGNLNGLIPDFLQLTGFSDIKTLDSRFPNIDIIAARKA